MSIHHKNVGRPTVQASCNKVLFFVALGTRVRSGRSNITLAENVMFWSVIASPAKDLSFAVGSSPINTKPHHSHAHTSMFSLEHSRITQ